MVLSISEFNQLLSQIIGSDPLLNRIWLTGTVTQHRVYEKTKTTYLTLSDGTSHINAVYFNKTLPDSESIIGQAITVLASPSFYTKRGSLQLHIHTVKVTKSASDLSVAFEALKQKLTAAGLFDTATKKSIPTYPQHIALITANPSAALSDFLNLKATLVPHINITIIPTPVQGTDAVRMISHAFDHINHHDVDLVVVLRGGGSAADLAAFNSESVVRSIHACRHPVISAVGHDCDVTLTDFVADYRAATPSDAIHTIAAPFQAIKQRLTYHVSHATQMMQQIHQDAYQQWRYTLTRAVTYMQQQVEQLNNQVNQCLAMVDAGNPLKKLAQGYSITHMSDHKIVRSHRDVIPGDRLVTQVADGKINSVVCHD